MIYAYLRQVSDINSLSKQQQDIVSYSLKQALDIDKEVMEYSGINHAIDERNKFEEFIHSLNAGDSIITQSLLVLSGRVDEIVKIINCMLSHEINLYITSSDTIINRDTSICEVFPLLDILSEDQKEKKNPIGRPKGSRSSSKFDPFWTQIIALLKEQMSVSAIARELNVSRSSLKDYIESRGIRKLIEKSWIEISPSQEDISKKDTSTLLMCPFDKKHNTKEVQS